MIAPEVSVVIPARNRAELLPRAIDSVVAQTHRDWEIVLVDDGSEDGTAALAAEYAKRLGSRFQFVHQPHIGASAARNRGIDRARGRFIAFLDSDDEFLPRKLERQIALVRLRPELQFVYGDYAFVDLEGRYHLSAWTEKFSAARRVPSQAIAPGLHVCTGDLFDSLVSGYFISTIVGLVRREALSDSIRFSEELSYAEEWLFYLQVVRTGPAGFVDEPLAVHHFVSDSLSRSDREDNTRRFQQVLHSIRLMFSDLTRKQRARLDQQLARSHRQIGYERQRRGEFARAVASFAWAFFHAPQPGVLGEWVHSCGQAMTAFARGRNPVPGEGK